VVGEVSDAVFAEIETIANAKSVSSYRFGRDFLVTQNGNVYRYKSESFNFEFESPLAGIVQRSNIGCALTACALSGIDIKTYSRGLASLHWPGRLESLVYSDKNLLIDCAHNQQGLLELLKELEYREMKEVLILFGILQRPDLPEIVELLARTEHRFALLTPPSPRAVSSSQLKEMFQHAGKEALEFDSEYDEALQYALSQECNQVVLTGSIYLVGAVREKLLVAPKPVWIRG
jgi:dihydrofolate synthase/folylpolyglutamate synthase